MKFTRLRDNFEFRNHVPSHNHRLPSESIVYRLPSIVHLVSSVLVHARVITDR